MGRSIVVFDDEEPFVKPKPVEVYQCDVCHGFIEVEAEGFVNRLLMFDPLHRTKLRLLLCETCAKSIHIVLNKVKTEPVDKGTVEDE
jgi:uncharacterized protein YlaI